MQVLMLWKQGYIVCEGRGARALAMEVEGGDLLILDE